MWAPGRHLRSACALWWGWGADDKRRRMWEKLESSHNLVHVAGLLGAYLQCFYLAGGSWVWSQPGLPGEKHKNKTNGKNHYTCTLIVSLTIINKRKHPNSHHQYWSIYPMEYCCTLKNERCTGRSALENLKTLCQLKEAGDISSLFMTVYVKCLEWASHRKQSSGCQCWGVGRWGDGKGWFLRKEENILPLWRGSLDKSVKIKRTEMGISPDAGYAMWIINCYLKTHTGFCRLVHRGDLQIPAGGNSGEEQLPAETAAQETPAVSNFSLSYICCFLELLTQCMSCPNRNAFYALLQRLNWEINSPIAFLQKEMS